MRRTSKYETAEEGIPLQDGKASYGTLKQAPKQTDEVSSKRTYPNNVYVVSVRAEVTKSYIIFKKIKFISLLNQQHIFTCQT